MATRHDSIALTLNAQKSFSVAECVSPLLCLSAVLTDVFDALGLQSIHSSLQHLVLHIGELVRRDEGTGRVGSHAAGVGPRVSVADALVVLCWRHH